MNVLARLFLLIAAMSFFALAGMAIYLTAPLSVVCLGIMLFAVAARKGHHAFTSYGSAKWATAGDLKAAGMLNAKVGLPIGRMLDHSRMGFLRGLRSLLFSPLSKSGEACRDFLDSLPWRRGMVSEGATVRLAKSVSSAIFGPPGSGKTSGLILPYLFECKDSMFVLDIKGELATISARARAAMGEVIIVDPYDIVCSKLGYEAATYNPLETLDPDDPETLDYCRDIANALVLKTGQEKEPHWNEQAEVFIAGIIAAVVVLAPWEDRSLQTVARILADGQLLKQVIEEMCKSDAFGGLLARMGDSMKHAVDKELSSTLTTVGRHLRFLTTQAILVNTISSSFSYGDFKARKMTVFLVMPPQHMRAQSGWMRMHFSSALREIQRLGLDELKKVQFVLDETATALGRMEALDDALALGRGWGINVHTVWQSMGQLQKVFPDGQHQTLLSLTSQIFFGVNDNEGANYVSDRCGDATVLVSGGSSTQGGGRNNPDVISTHSHGSSSSNWSETSSWQQAGRKLLKPEEVMALDVREAISFVAGIPPIRTRLVRWYEMGKNLYKGGTKVSFRLLVKSAAAAAFLLLVALGLWGGLTAPRRTYYQQPQNIWEQQFVPIPRQPGQPFQPPPFQPMPQWQPRPQPIQPKQQPFRPQPQPWDQLEFRNPRKPIT